MIRSPLTLAALAALVALALGLPGCETTDSGYRRSDSHRHGYYDDYSDRHHRSRCCYNDRAVSGPRGRGAPPPPPPPPP